LKVMPLILPAFTPNYIMYCLGLASYVEPMFVPALEDDNFTVTAIVPAFNEEQHIARTLESLLNQTKRLNGVIVVDDGSTDSTFEVARKFSEVQVLRNIRRIGKAESINRALDLVYTDLVMIVDADTVLEESFTEKTVKAFIDTDVAAASGFVIPSEKSVNKAIVKARVVEDFYSQTTLKRGQNMVNGLFVVSGCCAIFRTSILKQLRVPTGTVTEDLDLTWLLELEGHRTALIESYASTIEPKGLGKYVDQISRWYTGFFQCLHKHGLKVLSSKPLTLTVTFIFIECLVFTLLWVAALGLLVPIPWLVDEIYYLRRFVLAMLGVDLITVCFPAVLKAHSAGVLKDFLSGLPIYYSLRVVNTIVWWVTLVEWLFGWKAVWRKSH
jgi:cellulose synthase/poly-beta-1,6-N-acetylglucosamine synthase-like glycosyltransferase